MTAVDRGPLEYVKEWRNRFLEGGWWHSFELPDGTLIEGVSKLSAQKMRIAQFPIPDDLEGKRVLDIGAWDGWFSFEMERRGAEVLAVDRFDNPRFYEIRERLGSRVEYRQMDVYEITPGTVGYFDIVLFMGVFYHLKHPLLALERVCSVTRDLAAVESFILTGQHGLSSELEKRNLLQFFEADDFGGQVDNWFAPTTAALTAMCRTAGFPRVELCNRHDYGAALACRRSWEPPQPGGTAAPELQFAVNTDTFGINFRSTGETNVTCRILAPGVEFTRDSVFPEVDGYGMRPLIVDPVEGGCEVHFMLPPGLEAGWHNVRLRVAGSLPSNALRIAVDMEPAADTVEVTGACDGVTWQAGRLSLSHGLLSVWVAGLPENADISNVRVEVDGRRQPVTFVGPPDREGIRQINVRVSRSIAGTHALAVSIGPAKSTVFSMFFEN